MKYSIIIPAYNAQDTIDKCLNSLFEQSYDQKNFEIIIVDDGSTDGTIKKVNKFYSLINNFKIIQQKNSGPSSARNTGMKSACGKYIIFIDSDDWIEVDFLSAIDSAIENFDILVHGCTCDFLNSSFTNRLDNCHAREKRKLISLLDQHFLFSAPWLCVFKKKIIDDNNLLFDEELRYGEDVCFSYSFLLNIDSITYLDNVEYHYNNTNVKSITKGYVKNRYPLCKKKIELRKRVYERFQLTSDENKRHCVEAISDEVIGCIHNVSMKKSRLSIRKSAINVIEILNDKELMNSFEKEYHKNSIKGKLIVKYINFILKKKRKKIFVVILVIVIRINDLFK